MLFALKTRSVAYLLILCFGLSHSVGSIPLWGEEDVGYVFSGITPLKVFKKEFCPVVGTAKKGILIQTPKGEKKAKYGQDGIGFKGELVATQFYAEIENFDFSFGNRAQERREFALQNALDAGIEYSQAKMDEIDSTTKTVVSGQPNGMTKEEFRESLADGSDSSRQLQETPFGGASQIADTIYLSFDIVPTSGFSESFAVILVYHDQLSEAGDVVGRLSIPSIERVGDLQAGVPNRINLELTTREQKLQNLELTIFLFSKDVEPIATNASGKIKTITLAELETVKKELRQRAKGL